MSGMNALGGFLNFLYGFPSVLVNVYSTYERIIQIDIINETVLEQKIASKQLIK
jgi:hypothetical protein